MEKKKFSGYRIAVVAAITLFVLLGSISTIGVMMTSIAEHVGATVGQVGIMYTYAGVSGAVVALFIAPTALKKLTPRWCLMLGTLLITGHIMWYGFASHMWEYYAAATIGGIGIGVGTSAAMVALLGEWFITSRGSVIGIVVGVSSFGGAFFQWLCGQLTAAVDYQFAYRIVSLSVLVVAGLLNLLFLRNKPADVGEEPLGIETLSASGENSKRDAVELPGLTKAEALKTPAFYLVFAGVLLAFIGAGGYASYIATLLKTEAYGMSVTSAANYSSLLLVIGAVATILGGRISDKMGNKVYLIYMAVASSCGLLIIILSGNSIVSMPALLILSVFLAALAIPNKQAMGPTVCTETFGYKDFAAIQVLLVAASQIGSAIMPLLVSALLNKGIDLANCFWIFLVCTVAGMVLCLLGMSMSPLKKNRG